MRLESINPATGEILDTHDGWSDERLEHALETAATAARAWRERPLGERAATIGALAARLRERSEALARLASLEMGKPIREARAEIEKSAWACEYYAEHAAAMLAPTPVGTDATRSYIDYEPLGTVLAIMPWNFPYWQVFRHIAPTLSAGNTLLLKHAPNVPQVAAMIEEVVHAAGIPEGVFTNLPIDVAQTAQVIADGRVHAVTLTGSERAGRSVAALAGQHLKKVVLELGGSDAFIVLDDADLDRVLSQAVTARFQNGGQSCIAAKRMILTPGIAEAFAERFVDAVARLKVGNPLVDDTQIGPMARADLRDELARQVDATVAAGAHCALGGQPIDGPGFFYAPTVLDHVEIGTPAYHEELFGPVATLIRVQDADEALDVANGSRFGLGASVWTADEARGEQLARALESGCAFVNGMVKSDPRLPFGGVKASGYGRELGLQGIHEFINCKSVWIK
ncbi:NAD-dependent succinate-semialdehyde dehydrogenase [Acidihalobacter ferrooxydans]|uniref:NADP-dependent succinic semialdehyde dehydrogenase n=1 Tax=Acidihalobacter ferrooxydans TaxID=1765967 RepID=A0A1P8UD55_9GAMM|nr:NAD-dependent succinate-semialdehyde dehydrogenase [Acidihalobacter ferrooxydans]APZ41785.1 NADP-dependent succinic semialdehyde dehydrogenase [Acidihalobacter ferrooxydans]